MIPVQILHEHEGKTVSVYTSRSSFDGVLSVKNSGLLVVLKPNDKYSTSRYGSTYIDVNSIIAIREILPRSKDEDEDKGEDDCCEKESPLWKKTYLKDEKAREDKQMVGPVPGYDEQGKQITGNYVMGINIDYQKDSK
jgi:hypothetical protein